MTINKGVVHHSITAAHAGQRLDNFLMAHLKGAPRSLVYRILRKGEVRVNGGRAKPFRRLCEGDDVRIPPVKVNESVGPRAFPPMLVDLIKRAVIYENDRIVVFNKPGKLAVHSGSGVRFGMIDVVNSIPEWSDLKLAHRLDRDTSGCLVLARSGRVQADFQKLLNKGAVTKKYMALLLGQTSWEEKAVDAALARNLLSGGERKSQVDDEGKQASSIFRVLERYRGATLVDCQILTGRTHQIRAHAQHLGHPIVGDEKYASAKASKRELPPLKRHFLHCHHLQFQFAESDESIVHAPLPEDLSQYLSQLS